MVKVPDHWQKDLKAAKATQVAFDVEVRVQKWIKHQAIDNDLSAADQTRKILGLSTKKPVRPRLTISLSDEDYQQLAETYGLDPEDRLGIKEQAIKQILDFVEPHLD